MKKYKTKFKAYFSYFYHYVQVTYNSAIYSY